MRRRFWLGGALVATGVAACGDAEIVAPAVLMAEIYPPHGSQNIALDVEALVYFTSPVADALAAAGAIELDCRGTGSCASAVASGCASPTVAATVSFDAEAQVAHLKPAALLSVDTCYVVTVDKGIAAADHDVGPTPSELRSTFLTRH